MRGSVSTLIIFLVCLVAVLLYWFVGRPQFTNKINSVRAENLESTARLAAISEMEKAIPLMMRQLPEWRRKLELYQASIPSGINDEVFLAALNQQLTAQDVELLSVNLVKGGAWLGQLGEAQAEELVAKGIDKNVAQQVQVAFYSIRLIGDFDNVITAFENLKIHNRLFSIDQVDGPVTGGAGMVSSSLNPDRVPIEITGRIYYGIPAGYLTIESLVELFNTAVIIPKARSVQTKIAGRGIRLVTGNGAPRPEAVNESDDTAPLETLETDDATSVDEQEEVLTT